MSFVLATATAAGLAVVAPSERRVLPGLAFAGLLLLGAICLAFRPTAFVLDEQGLEVRLAVRGRRIPAPLTAERVSLSSLIGARLLGSGGLFGYLGTFKVDEGDRVSAALDGAALGGARARSRGGRAAEPGRSRRARPCAREGRGVDG